MEKIILGIDPGTNIMGYGLLKIVDGKAQMITMGVIDLRKFPDAYLKLGHIFERVTGIIDGYLPDEMAIEAPFFGKNVQSMLKLGRAQGVAIAAAMSRDLSFSEYEPTTIKQTVTGNGLASKKQVEMMLRSLMQFPDEPRYLDATDALAVAYTCFVERSNPLADVREQLKVKAKRQTKSRRKAWADYVSQNPEIIDN